MTGVRYADMSYELYTIYDALSGNCVGEGEQVVCVKSHSD